MRHWLIAFIATVTVAVSVGLLAAPAGAQVDSGTVVTDNSSSVSTGGTLTFTATVSGTGGTPTGSVAWSGSACDTSTTTLVAGVATCSIDNAQAGTAYSVTAIYSGDTNYTGSSGGDTASPGKASSGTAVTDNSSSVSTGGTLVFVAIVSGPGGTPTGSVAWTGSACSATTDLSGGAATCSIDNAQAGTAYSVTATYSGDTNYTGSSGGDTASPGKASSGTAVTDNSGSVSTGGTLTFTATVSGPGGTPTGPVAWSGSACDTSTTTLAAGVATCSFDNAQAGTAYSVTATYGGDTNYSGSVGGDGPVSPSKANQANLTLTSTTGTYQTPLTLTTSGGSGTGALTFAVVDGSASGCAVSTAKLTSTSAGTCLVTATKAADANYNAASSPQTTVTLDPATSATSVTDNSGSVSTGGTLVFVAIVSGPGGTPTGSLGWTGSACSATTALSAGVATCSIDNAQAGTAYSVTATYSGDANYAGSFGTDTASPGKADQTPLTITSTVGTYPTPLPLTTSGGSGTGALTFAVVDGSASGCVISTATTPPDLTSTSAGTCLVTATMAADANYNATSSPQTTVTLALAPSTTTIADNSASVSTGGTLVFVATVSGPGGTPTGSVGWTGSTCSATTALSAGVATCSIDDAQASTAYSVTATYSGNTNYSGSSGTDANARVNQAVPTAPTITNLPASGIYGGGFTAMVSTNGDGPKSVVSNSPGVCTVGSDGVTVTYVGVGTCSLNAQVATGPNYLARSGAAQNVTVGRAHPTTPTITNIPSPASEFFGFTAMVDTTGDGTTSVVSTTPGVCSVATNGLTVTFVGFGTCSLTPSVTQGTNYFGGTGGAQSFPVKEASHGYWLVGSDGGIFSFGTAAFHGSMGGTTLQRPVVGITPTSTGNGYWLVASDGGIFSFGDASFHGSVPGLGLHPAGSGVAPSLDAPIVGMVPTFTGDGYFMVASDGGVFAFGDARFEGSCPGIGGCGGAAVTVMPDRTGNGYWLVTSTGGVYAFGDATFYGAPSPSAVPVVDAVATPDAHGYWLLYANGVVIGYGDAAPFGSPVGYVNVFNPATSIFRTADGQGYWVASSRGDVFSYGDSPYLGGMAAAGLNGQIIAAFGF